VSREFSNFSGYISESKSPLTPIGQMVYAKMSPRTSA
jgi:hypothetical protein